MLPGMYSSHGEEKLVSCNLLCTVWQASSVIWSCMHSLAGEESAVVVHALSCMQSECCILAGSQVRRSCRDVVLRALSGRQGEASEPLTSTLSA